MDFSVRHSPKLNVSHFNDINSNATVEFKANYKRFKSDSHCKDVEEVIKLTEELVQEGCISREDLSDVRDGLKTLLEGYKVTVQKDHPFTTFVRNILNPNFNKKHDEKVILSLEHMIEGISDQIDLKEREAAEYNHLVKEIETGVNNGFEPYFTRLGDDQSLKAQMVKSIVNDSSFRKIFREMDFFIHYVEQFSDER